MAINYIFPHHYRQLIHAQFEQSYQVQCLLSKHVSLPAEGGGFHARIFPSTSTDLPSFQDNAQAMG